MNEEQPAPEQPIEAKPADPQSTDPRRRLRELLAVPERDRSDAVWDEIASLEIQLAPGNRAASPQADAGRSQEPARRPEQGRRQGPPSGAKPGKRFFQRPGRGPRPPNKT